MTGIDLSAIAPNLRYLYAGHVVREERTAQGAVVRVWDTCLPDTTEERTARLRQAWSIADGIARRENK